MRLAGTAARLVTTAVLAACGPPPIDEGGEADDTDTTETDTADAGFDGGMDAGADTSPADTDTDSTDTDTGTATDTETEDGTCEPSLDISPLAPVVGTTVGEENSLSSYSCTPLAMEGPDIAYRYRNTAAASVSLTALLYGPAGVDLDLFLLAQECAAGSCAAYGTGPGSTESASAIVPSDGELFISIDGYGAAAAGPFTLTLEETALEASCQDGADDDDDGATDCWDDDCSTAPECAQICAADAPITCGETVAATTAGASDDMHVYAGCAADMDGPEVIWELALGEGAKAAVTLFDQAPGLGLMVLEGACDSGALLACGADTALLPASTGSYFVVVDGAGDAEGAFSLEVSCRELACGDGEDNDGDGLADCDDPDCAADSSCVETCDLLSSALGCGGGADAGIGCYLLSPSPPTGFCHAAGDAGVGEPCAAAYDCVPGAVCAPADLCLLACDTLDGDPACPLGDCVSIGADPLGVCW